MPNINYYCSFGYYVLIRYRSLWRPHGARLGRLGRNVLHYICVLVRFKALLFYAFRSRLACISPDNIKPKCSRSNISSEFNLLDKRFAALLVSYLRAFISEKTTVVLVSFQLPAV